VTHYSAHKSDPEDADRRTVGLGGFKDAGPMTLVMVPLVAEKRYP